MIKAMWSTLGRASSKCSVRGGRVGGLGRGREGGLNALLGVRDGWVGGWVETLTYASALEQQAFLGVA